MAAILEGHRLTKIFGGLTAVCDLDFEIGEGEILGLIGPNGAGKTTLLNLINGIFPVTQGELLFGGTRLNGLKPYQITRLGIGRAFQVVRAFEGLTVKENVLVGNLFGRKKPKDIHKGMKEVETTLDFLGLAAKMDRMVSEITIADRKRLELARALSMEPKLLLLDEVMAGLNQREVEDLMEVIIEINRKGIAILVIEHVMKAVMGISHRIMVLHHGKRIALGSPKEIAENEKVIESYLGERFARKEAERRKQSSPPE
ncbi:MAG: ABC transporter ATP-binding protein [Syntrophorhabdales bacterium]|jgi:branched-chain amino acid transport system ATP-binding protein